MKKDKVCSLPGTGARPFEHSFQLCWEIWAKCTGQEEVLMGQEEVLRLRRVGEPDAPSTLHSEKRFLIF